MMMNTHLLISKSILDSMDCSKTFFLSDKNFLYGNIKPDITSKYLFQKHYLDESFEMIMLKIKYLSSFNVNSLSKQYSVASFSQELGVICHFLCDFFCFAHSQRWELKHSFSKHLGYERNLNEVSKETNLLRFGQDKFSSFEDFFTRLYTEYRRSFSYENDLYFATYICNSVVNYILDSILENTINSYSIIV
jgi:hypothetical protein